MLVGNSEVIKQVREEIDWASKSDAKILLTGESGVGKEVVARMIHAGSSRAQRPLVSVNCAGVPDSLLASELFGHARGSFTDAHRDRIGWLESANRGTVFLDEVGEMSMQMQALLLRFLENGEIQRVGDDHHRMNRVDVRVITATNRRLYEGVEQGKFREDLYYRLNAVHIEIPPLRQRRSDIPELLGHFMRRFAVAEKKPMPRLSTAAMDCLTQYAFPGNVRELRNLAERLIVRLQKDEITEADLPAEYRPARFQKKSEPAAPAAPTRAQILFDRIVEHEESFWSAVHEPFMMRDITREDLRSLVRGGLQVTRGNYKALVELFNMPSTDYKKFLNFLRKYQANLPVQEFRTIGSVTAFRPRERASAAREVAAS
jgi:DNA-binding NtrC family response regulator